MPDNTEIAMKKIETGEAPRPDIIVISKEDNPEIAHRVSSSDITVLSPEALFIGVLRQDFCV